MKTEKDIFNELMGELNAHRFHDVGYDNIRGNKMIMLHDVNFTATYGYVIPNHDDYEDMKDGSWYKNNYRPIVDAQYDKVLNHLRNNKNSRQAIFFYGSQKEHEYDEMICTMYVNAYVENDVLVYSVHMRSNDVIEYQTDVKFHESVVMKLCKDLGYVICRIEWHVDNFHMYINEGTIKAINKMYADNIIAMTNEINTNNVGFIKSKIGKINKVLNEIAFR